MVFEETTSKAPGAADLNENLRLRKIEARNAAVTLLLE